MAKGIPYGISDFSRLIDQNYYYVDKNKKILFHKEVLCFISSFLFYDLRTCPFGYRLYHHRKRQNIRICRGVSFSAHSSGRILKECRGTGVLHHSSCPSYPTTSCSSKTIPSAGANGKPKQRQTALSTARNSITYDAYYWPDERAASRRNALDVPRRKWHIHGLHPFINHSLKSPTRTLLTSIFSGTGTTRLRDRRLLNHRSVSLTAFRGIRKRVL